MAKYLSLDTEATGLTAECVLIQLAFVPVDAATRKVHHELGREFLVQCKSFEELKPTLNSWVVQHNEGLIRKAHAEGIPPKELGPIVSAYLKSPEMKKVFGDSRMLFLGKSLSALDIPLLTRTFGEEFMREHFHHHTVDVTCIARYMVDSGLLPPGCESTSQIVKHFKVRDVAAHTALADAADMAEIYVKMLAMAEAWKKASAAVPA